MRRNPGTCDHEYITAGCGSYAIFDDQLNVVEKWSDRDRFWRCGQCGVAWDVKRNRPMPLIKSMERISTRKVPT